MFGAPPLGGGEPGSGRFSTRGGQVGELGLEPGVVSGRGLALGPPVVVPGEPVVLGAPVAVPGEPVVLRLGPELVGLTGAAGPVPGRGVTVSETGDTPTSARGAGHDRTSIAGPGGGGSAGCERARRSAELFKKRAPSRPRTNAPPRKTVD